MGKFISANQDENSTLEQARKLIRQRALLGLPSLGIVANAQGGQEMVDEADFAANSINGDSPACLLIRTSRGDGSTEDNAIPDFGGHINVGQTLRMIARAPNVVEGIRRVLANEGVTADLDRLPGVSAAKVNAVLAAWEGA